MPERKLWTERTRSGKFRARWRNPDGSKASGKLFDHWDAAERFARLEQRSVARSGGPGERTEFVAYAHDLLQRLDGLSDTTRSRHLEQLHYYLAHHFTGRSVASLRRRDVDDLLGTLKAAGRADTTRALVLHTLKLVLAQAVREGLLEDDVAKEVPYPPSRHAKSTRAVLMRPLEPAVVEDLAEGIRPERLRLAVLLGAYAGLRIGEVGALMDDAVDRETKELRVIRGVQRGSVFVRRDGKRCWLGPPKSAASLRSVPLDEWLLDEIEGHIEEYELAPDGRLFWAPRGGLVDGTIMSHYFRKTCRHLGLAEHVTFHTLRHTFASLLIREGAHPKVVQTLMGHASLSLTMDLYGHLFPGMGREWITRIGTRRQEARSARLRVIV